MNQLMFVRVKGANNLVGTLNYDTTYNWHYVIHHQVTGDPDDFEKITTACNRTSVLTESVQVYQTSINKFTPPHNGESMCRLCMTKSLKGIAVNALVRRWVNRHIDGIMEARLATMSLKEHPYGCKTQTDLTLPSEQAENACNEA